MINEIHLSHFKIDETSEQYDPGSMELSHALKAVVRLSSQEIMHIKVCTALHGANSWSNGPL